MTLTVKNIAEMMDLSCVKTNNTRAEIHSLVDTAIRYGFGQVSIMQCYIEEVKNLLSAHPEIHVVGNVSFPSGSDTTTTKVFQAKEMVAAGCDEIDTTINVGWLLSGDLAAVEADIAAVVNAAGGLPVKVIIEVAYLTPELIETASLLAVNAGAAFVKTGTGWANRSTTLDDVKLIKAVVGDRIKIKASGGIRSLATVIGMYKLGARRFGVNMKSGVAIVEEALAHPEMLSF